MPGNADTDDNVGAIGTLAPLDATIPCAPTPEEWVKKKQKNFARPGVAVGAPGVLL